MRIWFGGVGILLIGVLALQWVGWEERLKVSLNADDDAQSPAPVVATLPNAADLLTPPPPREEYSSVIERSLFLPDRRIPEPRPAEQAPQLEPEAVDDSALAGLDFNAVLLSEDVSLGWVRLPPKNDLRRLQKGDKIQQWTVADISKDSLLLRFQDAERRFMLRDYAHAPPPIPPTRMPPPSSTNRQRMDGGSPQQVGRPPLGGSDTPALKPKLPPRGPSFGPG
ncbi:hypothetical protein [Rhabdochromatium marinum]|uniref:hypothetical protein n=1 Tax=Rhabdochromatium marinum TaxID=48729 RepID=UPI0019037E31|nr:hypothetical protein [Rhabdochromatium marinum]